MIRPICRMGNPVLRNMASEVLIEDIKSDRIGRLILDMKDSMSQYGGIGIAAPQIGVSLQVCLIELQGLNRYGQDINLPFTVFINPKIEVLGQEVKGYWEGCLSIPGLRGFVERPQHILVKYFDQTGKEKELEAKGFLATVVQHELDHLFGILYVDRIKSSTHLSFQEEFEEFNLTDQVLD